MTPTGEAPGDHGESVTGRDVARSVRWTYATTGAGLLVQLCTAAILARLLTDTDYGTVAIAAGALRFLQYLTDLGLGSVVIQKPDFRTDSEAPLLFAIGIAVNLTFAAALWLAAPVFLLLMPQLAGDGLAILRVLAVVGVIGAAGQVARALLARRLDFRTAGLVSLVGLAVGQGAVAVPLAIAGFGAWSLVAGLAVQTALGTALAWGAAPHALVPRRMAWARWRELAVLGGGFSVLRVLDSAGVHLLPLAVGTLAGVAAVGQWDRAWALSLLPVETLATGLGRVLFPAFSRLAATPARLQRAWLGALTLSACALAPVGAGMAVAAPEIVAVVLGPTWQEAAALVTLLALWAVLRGIAQVTGSLCEAAGRVRLRGLHQAGYLAVLAIAVAVLRPDTGIGVAAILLAVEIVGQVVLIALTARVLGMSAGTPLARLAAGMSVAPVVAAACAGMLAILRSVETGPAIALTGAIATCAIVLPLAVALHPSARLRCDVGRHVLGQALGISVAGQAPLSRLRRFMER